MRKRWLTGCEENPRGPDVLGNSASFIPANFRGANDNALRTGMGVLCAHRARAHVEISKPRGRCKLGDKVRTIFLMFLFFSSLSSRASVAQTVAHSAVRTLLSVAAMSPIGSWFKSMRERRNISFDRFGVVPCFAHFFCSSPPLPIHELFCQFTFVFAMLW